GGFWSLHRVRRPRGSLVPLQRRHRHPDRGGNRGESESLYPVLRGAPGPLLPRETLIPHPTLLLSRVPGQTFSPPPPGRYCPPPGQIFPAPPQGQTFPPSPTPSGADTSDISPAPSWAGIPHPPSGADTSCPPLR
ncbi:hypothetical protein FKM82_023935, partial [Ascaphus truei]